MRMQPDQELFTPAVVRIMLYGPEVVRFAELSPSDATMFIWLIRGGAPAFREVWRESSLFLRGEAERLQLKMNPWSDAWYAERVERRFFQRIAERRYGIRASQRAIRVSFHESAHAILALEFGLSVRHVSILPGGAPGGYAVVGGDEMTPDCDLTSDQYDRRFLETTADAVPRLAEIKIPLPDYLRMTLAGVAAELRAIGRGPRGWDSGWHDRLCAEHLLGEAHRVPPWSPELDEPLAAAERQAARDVDRLWQPISACAEALLERGRLSGDELRGGKHDYGKFRQHHR